ncbi:hypothetical protein [Streptomyces sp. Tu6071]|uniref:hypothetical protein n=1 Tax=Streptomyces sp. Tu6071 TaxID=355249 RepID=UPI0005B9D7D8|nr:hypothetical protein [Streptomyces sp. Tu6071]
MTSTPPRGDGLRALTVRQPWASCIAHGSKRVENRTRPWWWRGWFLIHAGRGTDHQALTDPRVTCTFPRQPLEFGAVLAVARLTDCHQDEPGRACSAWADPEAWHLTLTDVTPLLEPIPALGRLGLWRPSCELTAHALAQLPHLKP